MKRRTRNAGREGRERRRRVNPAWEYARETAAFILVMVIAVIILAAAWAALGGWHV